MPYRIGGREFMMLAPHFAGVPRQTGSRVVRILLLLERYTPVAVALLLHKTFAPNARVATQLPR